MANSRHLYGNVLSRVKGLLSSGVLKTPPLWYDIVQRFEPSNPTAELSHPPKGRPEVIVFPQDKVRQSARANVKGFTREPLNLFSVENNEIDAPSFNNSLVEGCVKRYEELSTSKLEDERLVECSAWFEAEMSKRIKKKETSDLNVTDSVKEPPFVNRRQGDTPENILALLEARVTKPKTGG